MRPLNEIFRQARGGLDLCVMARLVELDEARVEALESGRVEPAPSELDSYARAFGLPVGDFASGASIGSPLARFFLRAADESGFAALEEATATRAHMVVGEFLRCVHYLNALDPSRRRAAGALLKRSARSLDGAPPYGADLAAARLRLRLGLGPTDPVDSMRRLLSNLNVSVFYVAPDDLTAQIDGASVATPREAILVNLVGGPSCWWRTRMTLAHELCHLLLDHQSRGHDIAIISPTADRTVRARWRFFEGFDRVEQRANAFAAHFLAPEAGVRQVVGDTDPTSEGAITGVCQRFGVGRTTATWRLDHTFHLGVALRSQMLARNKTELHEPTHADLVEPSEVGLHAGRLRELAIEAFAADRLDAVAVRAMLGLLPSDPLPDDPRIDEDRRRPLRLATERVLAAATRYLERHDDTRDLVAVEAHPVAGGWRVALMRCRSYMEPLEPTDRACLVTYDLGDVRLAA